MRHNCFFINVMHLTFSIDGDGTSLMKVVHGDVNSKQCAKHTVRRRADQHADYLDVATIPKGNTNSELLAQYEHTQIASKILSAEQGFADQVSA
jgi:hypothetical protein